MNAKHLVLAITTALPWSVVVQAQPIFFGEPITSDTIIDAGNPYPLGFGAYNAGGGSPDVKLVDEGEVGGWAVLYDESRPTMSGGSVGGIVSVLDGATFTMSGGVVGTARSPTTEGGDVIGVGSSAIHVRGGRIATNFFELFEDSQMHFYGTNLELESFPGGFTVNGLLEDGQEIEAFGNLGPRASVSVHNVPGPASLSLAAVDSATLLWRSRFPLTRPRLQRG